MVRGGTVMTTLNLPNTISLLRVFLAPLIMVILTLRIQWGDFLGLPYGDLLAGVIFIIAALTDTVDGYIARKKGLVTNFGKLVDPLADKILVTAVLIALVELQRLPAWIVVVIVSREFFVTGLRMVAISEGRVVAASKWGKAKTIIQILAILIVIFNLPGGFFAMVLAMFITVASGIDYFWKLKDIF